MTCLDGMYTTVATSVIQDVHTDNKFGFSWNTISYFAGIFLKQLLEELLHQAGAIGAESDV